MLTFQDFISFKETSAYNLGNSVLGQATLDPNSEKSITAAMQAFEIVMSYNSNAAITFLNHMSEIMPEIKTVLQQHGLDNFKGGDFKSQMKRAAQKGKRVVKGLADVTPDDVKDGADVIAGNSSDSFHNPIG